MRHARLSLVMVPCLPPKKNGKFMLKDSSELSPVALFMKVKPNVESNPNTISSLIGIPAYDIKSLKVEDSQWLLS